MLDAIPTVTVIAQHKLEAHLSRSEKPFGADDRHTVKPQISLPGAYCFNLPVGGSYWRLAYSSGGLLEVLR